MANYALLTASGQDRPGIVAAIVRVLFESDCNVEDSQMARLGPEFACMLAVRMPEGLLSDQLAERFRKVSAEWGLRVHVSDLRPEEAGQTRSDAILHVIRVHGADRKGIVYRLTEHLAARGVNIANLQTEVIRHQPPLYVMVIEAELPSFLDAAALRDELVAIGREIQVEVRMEPKGPDSLSERLRGFMEGAS